MLKKIKLIIKIIRMRIKKTTTKQQYKVKTTKYLWLFKKFESRGQRFDGWDRRGKQWHWRW